MRKSLKVLIFLSVIFLIWILAAPFLAENLIVEKPLEKADAILVLSGSAVYEERTNAATRLYQQGVSKKILLTDDGDLAGWSQLEQKNPPFVYLEKQILISQGVAAADIEILDDKVTGTIWEARGLQKRIEAEKLNSVLLVTSAYHTKRALGVFQKVIGDDAEIGIIAVSPGEQTPAPQFWWLSPKGWQLVAGEYVKSFIYWIYY